MAQVAIDTRDLKEFSRAIRSASRKTQREFRHALIAADARARADEYSDKIAGTIETKVYGAAVSIVAGDEDTPQAILFELGNSTSDRNILRSERSQSFRHPVFGNTDVWVEQDMHPFLGPAALEHEEEALELLMAGVNKAFGDVRLFWE